MIQSVQKAVRLLQELDTCGGWLGVRELSRRVNLNPPSVHNLLTTLREMSFVEYDASSRQYRLGLGAIRLGEGMDPINQIRVFARPYAEALSNEFHESVVVAVWRDDQEIAVDWIQARHPLTVAHNHGVIEHPISFATGRVLLAHLSRESQMRYAAREDFSKLGPNSPLTTAEMLELLEKVAMDGFAVASNVGNSAVVAVAAPVYDSKGNVIFAIGCSEPMARSSDTRLENVKNRLLEITNLMTKRMGGRAPVLSGTAPKTIPSQA